MQPEDLAQAWPVGHFIQEELEARGWTTADLASRMGGETAKERSLDRLGVEFLIAVDSPDLTLGIAGSEKLGKAFGVSPQYFLNLEKTYRAWASARTGKG
jgi:plasmid maintenance system antidote protein VapI